MSGENENNSILKCKPPSLSVCLVVVLLLSLVIIMIAIIIAKIRGLTDPLNKNIDNQDSVIYSIYVNMVIVEKNDTYTIYCDNYTGVLYIELKSNGYSSALTPLLNDDGTPKLLSDF